MQKLKVFLVHLFAVTLLTVITQIGGVIYLLTLALFWKINSKSKFLPVLIFGTLYLLATFFIVPLMAPWFGREKIKENRMVEAKHWFYVVTNRNYVKPRLNHTLQQIAKGVQTNHPQVKIIFMDASFPFIDGFPLLPHLYHDDGRKVDVALIYEDSLGSITNRKPTVSGYGYFERPHQGECNQVYICKSAGEWQYDFTRYLTFGTPHEELKFSAKANFALATVTLNNNSVDRIFIEPHLRERLSLHSSKVWYHGCQSVRHDDHIHIELKEYD